MIEQWHERHPGVKKPRNKPFPPTSGLRRRLATAISRLRASLTAIDSSPLRPAEECASGSGQQCPKHIFIDCSETQVVQATAILYANHKGPRIWQSLTNDDIRRKNLIGFMAMTGLQRIRQIITTDQDARDAGYELGEDI